MSLPLPVPTTENQQNAIKVHPEFIMPLDANIPEKWIAERGEGYIIIVFPGWGTGTKREYNIRMDAFTRKLTCDPECLGFKYHHHCHHLPGLIWCCHKPSKTKGPIWSRNQSYWKFTDAELDDRQRKVYAGFKKFGPISNRKLTDALGWEINRVTGRCKELRNMGCVAEWGKEYDADTDRWVTVWFACAEMPVNIGSDNVGYTQ